MLLHDPCAQNKPMAAISRFLHGILCTCTNVSFSIQLPNRKVDQLISLFTIGVVCMSAPLQAFENYSNKHSGHTITRPVETFKHISAEV